MAFPPKDDSKKPAPKKKIPGPKDVPPPKIQGASKGGNLDAAKKLLQGGKFDS